MPNTHTDFENQPPAAQNDAFVTFRLSMKTKMELTVLSLSAQTSVSEIIRVLIELGLRDWDNTPEILAEVRR